MKPRSELVDRGVIDPTKEIFDIDVDVYRDLLETDGFLSNSSVEYPYRSLRFYSRSKVLNYILKIGF